jgi:hypothetical protein
MLFALPNLVSKAVTECTPWTFQGHIPDEVKGKAGKKNRDAWINDPGLHHQVYSGFEGAIANQRISEGARGSAEEGNPPFRLHAFVADIDCPVSDAELAAGLARIKIQPAYFERTLSGNARLLWLLAAPVTLPSRKFAIELLELALVRLKVDSIAPSLDKPAWLEPNRYYTNSCDFYELDKDARISAELTQGWMLEVAETHAWKKERNAVTIPLPIIFAEVEKKFPQHNWPGEFTEESKGPSFWLPASTSPKSAIVKPTGIFTFSSSATKSFYSWQDLLGIDFVKQYETEQMGKAVIDIYHDGTMYYRKDGFQQWRPYSKEDTASYLYIVRGLQPKGENGRASEVSRGLEYIRGWQGINGAAPFVFQPSGLIFRNDKKYLNTHTARPLLPAPYAPGETAKWGVDGPFPFLSRYFDGLFDPPEQLPFFLSWLCRFYRGAYTQNLESGQNIFLLGPPGVGKTFLSQGLLHMLLGGSSDAEDYLLGKTLFNSQLFEVGLWTVDDNSATVDAATHRKFTSMGKKMAANTTFEYHAKFRIPCSVVWLGRVFVTANDDEESARIVPDLSMSNIDKLMLLRATKIASVLFPARQELLRIMADELPHFARFLLDYMIPEHCLSTSRFGVKSYHEKVLMQTAEQSSRSAGLAEILQDWKQSYFGENPAQPFWEGTSYQFLKMLHKDQLGSAAGIRQLTADSTSRGLATLRAKGYRLDISTDEHGSRIWKIYRDELPSAVALPGRT